MSGKAWLSSQVAQLLLPVFDAPLLNSITAHQPLIVASIEIMAWFTSSVLPESLIFLEIWAARLFVSTARLSSCAALLNTLISYCSQLSPLYPCCCSSSTISSCTSGAQPLTKYHTSEAGQGVPGTRSRQCFKITCLARPVCRRLTRTQVQLITWTILAQA